ncbi:uncharacterized protein [Blastocystis hominis]|uniref:Importin subunit alpha n=1 Tax=Blastocystis hominis TaxID=12968 RepID=D8M5U3_BLAHO|nr:uncharacterized protein [Blastocystis hominis]CBK23542.2 unnamed protein product [Blastocystis hominis]|eukprot:XP_012897590.1 uncharacterized protein [Blastocystis hominis]
MFFRKLLSNDHHPPIDLVISTGLVPRFVSFLNYDNCPSLQYEAAWVITNIASGTKEQTAVVIQCGALPILLRLIESPDVGVREQASWALGNIAGDNAQSRDDIINAGGVELILKQLNKEDCTSFFQKNGVWLLSNLCRTRDDQPTDFERVKICLPYMLQMLQDSQEDVVTDACWCFAFITDYNKRNTAYILQMGVLPSIVQLLSKSNSKVVTPALRTVGNVLAGDDEQTQQCLNLNVVEYLGNLLASSNPLIVKEAAWCLSNITAGTVDQVQVVINYDLIPVLVELIRSGRSDVQKEACWAVCNAFCGGNMMQIGLLVSVEDAIPAISSMLVNESGSKLISIIIDSLDRILVYEKFMMQNGNLQSAVITQMLSDCGCLDNIEKLEAIDESTYEKTKDFIERHFGFEDEISFNDIN